MFWICLYAELVRGKPGIIQCMKDCASMETAAECLTGKGNMVKNREKGGPGSPVVTPQSQQSLLLQALQNQIARPTTFSRDVSTKGHHSHPSFSPWARCVGASLCSRVRLITLRTHPQTPCSLSTMVWELGGSMGSSGKPPGTPAEIPSTPSYHLQSHTPSSVNLLLEGLVSRTCWQKHAASWAKQPPGRDLFPRGGWKIGSVGHRRGTCGPHTPSWKESPARSCKIQPRWSCLHLPGVPELAAVLWTDHRRWCPSWREGTRAMDSQEWWIQSLRLWGLS